MSVGGTETLPPSACALAADASQSSTAKYTIQWGGTSAGHCSFIWIMPAIVRSPTLNSVYDEPS